MLPSTCPDYTGRLSVVVPVHDEADNILPLVEELHVALACVPDFEVLFVDDASTDATPRRLSDAAARFPRLKRLRLRQRCGQSTAVEVGVRAARHPWIATLDGDGQNDPADLRGMLAQLAPGRRPADLALVIGWRRRRRDSAWRRFASRVANGVRAALLRDGTPDTGCGLKVFARDVYLRLPFFDHQHRFLPALVQREGYAVRSVPVNHRPRTAGRSKYGVRDRLWVGVVDLLGVAWLQRRRTRPEVEAA